MMAAAATIDAGFTVKTQHGFVVKDVTPIGLQPRVAASVGADQALRLEDGVGAGSSGLSRAALGLLTPPTQPQSALTSTSSALYSISPGLPKAGDVRPAEYAHLTPGVKRLMRSVMRGLKAHQDPEAALEGLGGTYFFRNEAGTKIAIMKPCDEEPLAPNNPKGFVGRALGDPGLKPTVRVGEAAAREVAAYLLDHGRFARVPHTVMVRMSHPVFHLAPHSVSNTFDQSTMSEFSDPGGDDAGDLPLKLGSLQEFVPHDGDTSEIGASRFSVQDVQRIGILDLRLFNTDRHAGNILVRRARSHSAPAMASGTPSMTGLDFPLKEQYDLIPIDHGFALPEALEPPYFEWQHWPQAMMPFGSEELEYIQRLDPRGDADLLRRELPGLREESLRLLEVSTTLLQRCAAAGMSLSEIAAVVTRPLIGLDDDPSELENLCAAVRAELKAPDGPVVGLSDLEEEEEEEVENDEVDAKDHGLDTIASPGADSASTHFEFDSAAGEGIQRPGDIGGSDASRHTASMDDALFSMDEDGIGARTPLATSPVTRGVDKVMLRKAPTLVVRRSGEMATPGGVVGVSFGSALMSNDSLPPSYESDDSPTAPLESSNLGVGRTRSIDSESDRAVVFAGPASYMPGFATAAKAQAHQPSFKGHHAGGVRHGGRRQGQARRVAGRKTTRASAYPPLVEPRASAPCAGGVFSCLSPAQWDEFMRLFKASVDDAILSGRWTEGNRGAKPPPQMSCPKF